MRRFVFDLLVVALVLALACLDFYAWSVSHPGAPLWTYLFK